VRILELPAGATPRQWGQLHGESFRGEIRALAAIRAYLCTRVGGFPDLASVAVAARAHLPVLEAYDRALHDELCGIAEGAAVAPEDIVIANHYTDLRDLPPDPATWSPAPIGDHGGHGDPAAPAAAPTRAASNIEGDGCSVLWATSPSGRILAQTWDMHATAIPYVMTLVVPATDGAPAARLLSVTGCLGMAGLNGARVGIAINNLFSTDATLGVVWPAVVRRALRCHSAEAARDTILGAPIGSGHHYFVADRHHAFAIETSGTRRKQIFAGERAAYCHTNHSLDGDVAARSKVPTTSTTHDRMRWLEASLGTTEVADLADAWRRLGSEDGWPRSVCTNMATPESPHGAATCGAIAMNLDRGEVWTQQGFIHNVAAEVAHV
jgi:isopenicillin-N N-acyltransferase-like protein